MNRMKHFISFLCFLSLISTCAPSPSHGESKHFVLVHGAGHGAWCWYKVAALLTSIGHNVTALDMGASGISPKQIQQIHSRSDYIEPLTEFMKSLPPKEKVILVGHSTGGAAISVPMEMFPEKISLAVFATAVIPGPKLPYPLILNAITNRFDFMDSKFRFDNGTGNAPTAALFGPKLLASTFYQLSPPEDLTLAVSLVRYNALRRDEIKLTKKKYGSVRRVFIVCDQDLAIKEKVQRWMIDKNPPDEVKVINGCDNMVVFSKPLEFFSYLHNVSQIYS